MSLVNPAVRDRLRGLLAGESPWPLTLTGGVGCGKTCALLALCDFVPGAAYYTLADLHAAFELARQGKLRHEFRRWTPSVLNHRGGQSEGWYETATAYLWTDGLWGRLLAADLVVIDEVGKRASTPAQYDHLTEFLDRREGKPLCVATNLGLSDLGTVYDERLTSRLEGGTVLGLTDPDRRREVANGFQRHPSSSLQRN